MFGTSFCYILKHVFILFLSIHWDENLSFLHFFATADKHIYFVKAVVSFARYKVSNHVINLSDAHHNILHNTYVRIYTILYKRRQKMINQLESCFILLWNKKLKNKNVQKMRLKSSPSYLSQFLKSKLLNRDNGVYFFVFRTLLYMCFKTKIHYQYHLNALPL